MDGLSRRELLAVAGAVALGAAAPGVRGNVVPARARSAPRVIVVGAGLAGLVAATELERRGWRVTVLEARPRLGGRVLTLREPFAGGQHAEAGGEFIDRNHTRIRALVRSLELELDDVRRGFGRLEDVGFRNGRRLAFGVYAPPALRREMARFTNALFELSAAVDPLDPAASPGALELDGRSAASLIDALGIDGHARLLLEQYLRDDYGVEPERLSLLYAPQAERLYRGVPGGAIEQFRVRGGNDRMIARLARRLRGDVAVDTRVDSVTQTAAGVEVRAGGAAFEAERCVLTAPLPAMRSIAFDPPLEPQLAAAIAELQYARVTKHVAQYERRTWRRDGFSGTAYTDLPVASLYEATDQQPGRRGILISYAAGELSPPTAERLGAIDRLQHARAGIDRVFEGTAAAWAGGSSVAWATEPESGGAWCSYAPGQVTAYWRALRKPAGRVHFAGEHTSEFTGYMEGAVRSGERAAREAAIAGA